MNGYCIVNQDCQILQMGMSHEEAQAALLYYQTQGEVVEVGITSDYIEVADVPPTTEENGGA